MKRVISLLLCGFVIAVGCKQEPLSIAPRAVSDSLSVSIDTLASGSSESLTSISFSSASTGYCVGSGPSLLRTTNAGVTWIPLPTASFDSGLLMFVNFWSDSEGVVIAGGRPYRTTNSGSTWQQGRLFMDSLHWGNFFATTQLLSIVRLPDGRLLGSGQGGAFDLAPAAYISSDRGYSWYYSGHIDSNFDIGKTGDECAVRTSSYGPQALVLVNHQELSRGLWFSNVDSSVAVSNLFPTHLGGTAFLSSTDAMVVGTHGSAFLTTDAGLSWAVDSSHTSSGLNDVASSSGNVIVIGDSVVLYSHNSPWSLTNLSTTLGPLRAVTFRDATHAIAVGDGGRIYQITFN